MRAFQLEEIRQAIRGHWLTEHRPCSVASVSTDTRSSAQGDLFFALRGDRFDGHAFLEKAARAGCAAAVVAQGAEISPETASMFPAGVITVEDTTVALGDLASFNRRCTAATVVAVTGSNGKTTVKRMIHAILSDKLKGTCSPKNFNNNIGLPLTLLDVNAGDDYVVCEIGTNHLGEIASLSRIAMPDIAVITNVCESHLEGLGSLEQIASEKASILGFLDGDAVGIVSADNEELTAALRAYPSHLVRFGAADDADIRLTGYESKGAGQRFEVNSHLWVDLPLPGRHNALNALAAMAGGLRFGMDEAEASRALATVEPVEMRTEWIDAGGVTIINDAYNANPASMSAAADVLGGAGGKRRVMVVGDMGELGDAAKDLHLRTGGKIAACDIDLLIGVGRLGRYIAKGADQAGMKTETFTSRRKAVEGVCSLLKLGDVVLVKASRSVRMETLVEKIRSTFAAKRRPGRKSSKGD